MRTVRRFARRTLALGALGGLAVGAGSRADAQVASALLREGDPLPGGPPGSVVSSMGTTTVDHSGGFAITLIALENGEVISHVWGSTAGETPRPLATESRYGELEQTGFEDYFGLGDDGSVAYSAYVTHHGTGDAVDSVFLGPDVVALGDEKVPTLSGKFWSFCSRPGATRDGTPFFLGGVSNSAGGSTVNEGLFFGEVPAPLILGGTSVPGLPFPLAVNRTIDWDYRVSPNGNEYLAVVRMEEGGDDRGVAVVQSGQGLAVDGTLLWQGRPVPPSVGGKAGEAWESFRYTDVNDARDWVISGHTLIGAPDDPPPVGFVLFNGQFVARADRRLDEQELIGDPTGVFLNAAGDRLISWPVRVDGSSTPGLFVNEELVLRGGDAVDLDGDGIAESGSILTGLVDLATPVLSDRERQGHVRLFFLATVDVHGTPEQDDDVEALLTMQWIPRGPRLEARPQQISAGASLSLRTHSALPLRSTQLLLVAFDGESMFHRIAESGSDGEGRWTLRPTLAAHRSPGIRSRFNRL